MTRRHYPARHWYAICYPYRDALSECDTLAQFDSLEERNDFCERFPKWEPVTLASVRHRFNPRAFYTDDAHELNGIRTSRDQIVFYIYQRPNYQL